MPEMSEENYKALLERLEQQDKTIEGLVKKFEDMAKMNKVLMQTSTDSSRVQPSVDRKKELAEKLKGGIKHA